VVAENPVLWWIVLGSSAGSGLVLSQPVMRKLLHSSGDAPHILGGYVVSVRRAAAMRGLETEIELRSLNILGTYSSFH
jgi:hypothetical protein